LSEAAGESERKIDLNILENAAESVFNEAVKKCSRADTRWVRTQAWLEGLPGHSTDRRRQSVWVLSVILHIKAIARYQMTASNQDYLQQRFRSVETIR
jgi:hypothetical protein